MHEADIGEFFETYETTKTDKNGNIEIDENGKMLTVERERPRRLSNIPAEMRRNIEKVAIDSRGNAVPQLYSKLAASSGVAQDAQYWRAQGPPGNRLRSCSLRSAGPLSPRPASPVWWSAQGSRPGLASRCSRTCYGTPAATPWPTEDTTRARCKPISGTKTAPAPAVNDAALAARPLRSDERWACPA